MKGVLETSAKSGRDMIRWISRMERSNMLSLCL